LSKLIEVFAGHGLSASGSYDSGAVNVHYEMSETLMTWRIVGAMKGMWDSSSLPQVSTLTPEVRLHCFPYPMSLDRKIKTVNRDRPYLGIDVHLNAPLDPADNINRGTEVLCYSLAGKSGKCARVFQRHLLEALRGTLLGGLDRGVKVRQDLRFITKTQPSTIITESEFITCNEVARALRDTDLVNKIAQAHILAILEIGGWK